MKKNGDAAKGEAVREGLAVGRIASRFQTEIGALLPWQILAIAALEKLARLDAELMCAGRIQFRALIPQPPSNLDVACAPGARARLERVLVCGHMTHDAGGVRRHVP